jgi:hypothetical protein
LNDGEHFLLDNSLCYRRHVYLCLRNNRRPGSPDEDGVRLVIEEAKKASNVSRTVALSDIADLSILREAQKELGIKAR